MRIFTPRITSCIPGRKRFPEIEPLQRIEPGTQGVQFRIAAQIESPHLIVGKMQRGQIRKVFDSFERFYLHTTTRNRFHSKRLLPRYFAVPRNIVPHKIRFELRIGETDYFRRRELRDLRFCGNAASGNDDCPGTCVSNVNFCPEGKQRFILRGGQFDPVSLYFYLIDDIRLHLYLKLTGRSVEPKLLRRQGDRILSGLPDFDRRLRISRHDSHKALPVRKRYIGFQGNKYLTVARIARHRRNRNPIRRGIRIVKRDEPIFPGGKPNAISSTLRGDCLRNPAPVDNGYDFIGFFRLLRALAACAQ